MNCGATDLLSFDPELVEGRNLIRNLFKDTVILSEAKDLTQTYRSSFISLRSFDPVACLPAGRVARDDSKYCKIFYSMPKKFCKTFTASEKKKIIPVESTLGMIHSMETFGALDGPGLRVVVFFEGCPLRCVYCHNRDMLDMKDYRTVSAEDLLSFVKKYTPYFGNHGGVTVSGGDPIFQPKFLREFLMLCKKNKIHTAIDTSLFTSEKVIDDILPFTDLFMVSLKHFDSGIHKCLTGVSNELILENIRYLSKKLSEDSPRNFQTSRLWFRYLILPGYTDTRSNLRALVRFLHEVHFEKIELLPYHTYGEYKWKELGIPYVLEGTKPPSERSVRKIQRMLEKEGFFILYCHS